MLGLFLTDAEPFHTVYLHGIVRAEGGVEDEQDEGQRRRSARDDRGDRRRRAALRAGARDVAGQRPAPDRCQDRGGAQLHQQAVERGALRARQRGRSRWPSRTASPAWPSAGSARAWPMRPHAPPDSSTRSTWAATPATVYDVRLERLLRLVPGDGEGRAASRRTPTDGERAAHWWSAAAAGRHAPAPAASDHAVRDGGDLEALRALGPGVTDGEPLLISARWPTAARARTPTVERRWPTSSSWCAACATCAPAAGVPAGEWIPLAVAPGRWVGGSVALDTALRFLEPMARVRPIELRPGETAPAGAPATTSGLGVAWMERSERACRAGRSRGVPAGGDRAPGGAAWRCPLRRARPGGGRPTRARASGGAARRSSPA